jgi:hypothetical protein
MHELTRSILSLQQRKTLQKLMIHVKVHIHGIHVTSTIELLPSSPLILKCSLFNQLKEVKNVILFENYETQSLKSIQLQRIRFELFQREFSLGSISIPLLELIHSKFMNKKILKLSQRPVHFPFHSTGIPTITVSIVTTSSSDIEDICNKLSGDVAQITTTTTGNCNTAEEQKKPQRTSNNIRRMKHNNSYKKHSIQQQIVHKRSSPNKITKSNSVTSPAKQKVRRSQDKILQPTVYHHHNYHYHHHHHHDLPNTKHKEAGQNTSSITKSNNQKPEGTITIKPIKFKFASITNSHNNRSFGHEEEDQHHCSRNEFEQNLHHLRKQVCNPMNVSDAVPVSMSSTQINRQGALFIRYTDYLRGELYKQQLINSDASTITHKQD